MASKSLPLILLIFLLLLITSQTKAQAPAPAPAPAPAETLAPSVAVNLTAILEKSRHTLTLFILLKDFELLSNIQSQLDSTSQGITLFAPTNYAFQHFNPSTFKALAKEDKLKLFLYHVTPNYYTLSDLQTMRNPVRTLASDEKDSWRLNFTAHESQVEVTTGVVTVSIKDALMEQFPLVIYEVDEVLFPLELAGELGGDEFPPDPAPSS